MHPAVWLQPILGHLGAHGGPRKSWGGLRLGDLGTGHVRNMLYKLVPETKSKAHCWLRVCDLGTGDLGTGRTDKVQDKAVAAAPPLQHDY